MLSSTQFWQFFFQLLILLIFIFKGYWNSIDGLLNQQKQVKKDITIRIFFQELNLINVMDVLLTQIIKENLHFIRFSFGWRIIF